jgi:hypothetical protein
MRAYPTLLKQAVLPRAPHWSLAASSLLENSLQLRTFSGLPLGLALTAGPPWFRSLTSSRAVASAVLRSPGEQNPPDVNSHSRSKQPRTRSSRGRRSLSTSFLDPESKPCVCFRARASAVPWPYLTTIAQIHRISTRKKFPGRLPRRSRCILPPATVPSSCREESF